MPQLMDIDCLTRMPILHTPHMHITPILHN